MESKKKEKQIDPLSGKSEEYRCRFEVPKGSQEAFQEGENAILTKYSDSIFRQKHDHESSQICKERLDRGPRKLSPRPSTQFAHGIPTIRSSESGNPSNSGSTYYHPTQYSYPYEYGAGPNIHFSNSHGLISAAGSSGQPYHSYTGSPPSGYPYYQWTPIAPVAYISDIKPDDVLSGRGGATNSHSGNRAFRLLVKQYQDQYLKAKKRDKPAVASIIVEKIRESGGRFLKRGTTTPDGRVLWIDIGDERAKEKTCQALREGAPEIRRKRKATSSDEEDTKKQGQEQDHLSRNSSFGRSVSNDDASRSTTKRTIIVSNSCESGSGWNPVSRQQPVTIMIRPSSMLIRRRIPQTISVDQLSAEDRDTYLRDFVPPDSGIRQSNGGNEYLIKPSSPFACPDLSLRDCEKTAHWSIVKV